PPPPFAVWKSSRSPGSPAQNASRWANRVNAPFPCAPCRARQAQRSSRMSLILITPLSAIEETIRGRAPSHMVTLLSNDYMIDTPQGFTAARHLRLSMHDIADAGVPGAPAREHIDRLIAFGRGWDATAPMLVHCWAGVSRSTAAAFTLLCD